MSNIHSNIYKGQCLCGGVKFETPAPSHIDACHCKMCQIWTGSLFIGADFRDGITITRDEGLVWYESSDWAKRGFCKTCGSSLFYRLKDNDKFWAVSAGCLDLPKGAKLSKEIFIDEKPDYYALSGEHLRQTGTEFFASLKKSNDND
ncbi:MAG: GFA family protein [Robiginitomaculum sp.]|nr:GFA family protein [Robiginitomaculum sp.]